MRVLRDPVMASQHQNVITSLMAIFKALGGGVVTYLHKVGPQAASAADGDDGGMCTCSVRVVA
jgi:hypothetical protein